jgi:hypothetical protein
MEDAPPVDREHSSGMGSRPAAPADWSAGGAKWAQRAARDRPDVLAGVVDVDELDPLSEVLAGQEPDPGRPVGEDHHPCQPKTRWGWRSTSRTPTATVTEFSGR